MDIKKAAIPSVLIHFQEQDDIKSKRAGKNAGGESDRTVRSPVPRSPAHSSSEANSPALHEGFSLFATLFPLQKSRSYQEASSTDVFVEANHVTIRAKCPSPDLSPHSSSPWIVSPPSSTAFPPFATKPILRSKKVLYKTSLLDLDTPIRRLPSLRTGLVRQSTEPYLGMALPGRMGNSLTPTTKKGTLLPALSPITRISRQFPTF